VPRLVLASRSPRREELLRSAGLSFTVRPASDADESWHPGEHPVAYARRIALAKAQSVAATLDDAVVLAADTTVWIADGERPIGKPETREDALEMLGRLSGREHRVTTAYLLIDTRDREHLRTGEETSRVWMRRLGRDELDAYLDGGEWRDKAGGYAIQGAAAGFVTRIEGSYTNVVGLPLAQVVEMLAAVPA
jgi:septum formation protein